MALFGSRPMKNRIWAPGVRISKIEAPAEEWITDPSLPILGADPRFPTSDYIVIPRGRIAGVKPVSVNGTNTTDIYSRAMISIADGVDPSNAPMTNYGGGVRPLGFTESNIFRTWQEHIQTQGTVERQAVIEVPYIPAINAAYGALLGGDRLTAYYGSATTLGWNPNQRGMLAKWVGKRVLAQHTAASAVVSFSAASLPAFPPRIILQLNAGAFVTGSIPSISAGTLVYNGTNWVGTFQNAVTDVLFDYGQGHEHAVGEVTKLEGFTAQHQPEGWLQWVQDDFRVWDYPPMLMRVPTMQQTDSQVTYVESNHYRLSTFPIAPHLAITISLAPTGTNTFTITDMNGIQTTVTSGTTTTVNGNTITGQVLYQQADVPFVDYTYGTYYTLNPVTGDLFLSGTVQFNGTAPSPGAMFNQITATYSYETAYRDGRLFSPGIQNLTDGSGGSGLLASGVTTGQAYAGTPTNLDVLGAAGAMRAVIY